MNAGKIIKELERRFPPQLAMDWDNSGLQVGSEKTEVKKVVVALDSTDEVIRYCIDKKADMLVTHHPLMLDSLRKVNDTTMHGRKILALAENKIVHYAMHTNYDVAEMADLADHALKLKKISPLETTGTAEDGSEYGVGSVGELSKKMTAEACCELVKKSFGLDCVRLFGDRDRMVKRIAVCPGSGNSMVAEALEKKADLFITGDIGHHSGIDAVDQGLLIIDAGHYGVEQIFVAQVEALLKKAFPDLKVKTAAKHPFVTL